MHRAQPIHELSPQQIRHELATLFARGIVRLKAGQHQFAGSDALGDRSDSEKKPAAGLEDA